MRAITKRAVTNHHLDQAHQNPPAFADEATSRWRSFGYKEFLLNTLLDEQYGLCCYSELRADLEGLGYHIEHVEPKSQNPSRTFDYSNLAASALTSEDLDVFKTIQEDTFGGHAKRSDYDKNLFISCHNPDCSRYFVYLSDGRVVASEKLRSFEKQQADYTIGLLHLNCPYLVNRRKRWYDELDKLFEEHFDKNWSLNDLAAIDLLPTSGKLSPFFSVTRQFFGSVAEQVLKPV